MKPAKIIDVRKEDAWYDDRALFIGKLVNESQLRRWGEKHEQAGAWYGPAYVNEEWYNFYSIVLERVEE